MNPRLPRQREAWSSPAHPAAPEAAGDNQAGTEKLHVSELGRKAQFVSSDVVVSLAALESPPCQRVHRAQDSSPKCVFSVLGGWGPRLWTPNPPPPAVLQLKCLENFTAQRINQHAQIGLHWGPGERGRKPPPPGQRAGGQPAEPKANFSFWRGGDGKAHDLKEMPQKRAAVAPLHESLVLPPSRGIPAKLHHSVPPNNRAITESVELQEFNSIKHGE